MDDMQDQDVAQLNRRFDESDRNAQRRGVSQRQLIAEIIRRLDRQDQEDADYRADNAAYRAAREKQDEEKANAYGKLAIFVKEKFEDRDKKQDAFMAEIAPLLSFAKNVEGFDKISKGILKGVLLVGAAIGVIYGFFRWIKQ